MSTLRSIGPTLPLDSESTHVYREITRGTHCQRLWPIHTHVEHIQFLAIPANTSYGFSKYLNSSFLRSTSTPDFVRSLNAALVEQSPFTHTHITLFSYRSFVPWPSDAWKKKIIHSFNQIRFSSLLYKVIQSVLRDRHTNRRVVSYKVPKINDFVIVTSLAFREVGISCEDDRSQSVCASCVQCPDF